nr:hypothetical protein [Tanacetum cinerariifolium]
MRTRSSSNLPVVSPSNSSTSNPKHHNRTRSKQPFILEESFVDTMADQCTMAELLRAPIEDYVEAIVVPLILAKQFELKHSLINMMTSDQFFGLEKDNSHDHFHWGSPPEICVTCGGGHPYYQFLVAGGNTFLELQDNIQGYVSAAAVNYNQGNFVYRPLEVDERVEETLTDPNLSEYTIKVLPHPVQKYRPLSHKDYVVHQRDPLHSNIPYPSRMLKQKRQEKDEVQIHKFWQMFKQLHINITLADALTLMPKYQKMLKALLSNKDKLQELANTPLNENYSAYKALADLGASINLIPLSVWKKLGLPNLISTRMTFELANRAICTPAGIARDVFIPVGKFTFPANFVIVDYESDPRKESINLINVFNDSSEDFLVDLFPTNQPSGNPTFSSHSSLEVQNDIFYLKRGNALPEKLLDLDSTKDLHP